MPSKKNVPNSLQITHERKKLQVRSKILTAKAAIALQKEIMNGARQELKSMSGK